MIAICCKLSLRVGLRICMVRAPCDLPAEKAEAPCAHDTRQMSPLCTPKAAGRASEGKGRQEAGGIPCTLGLLPAVNKALKQEDCWSETGAGMRCGRSAWRQTTHH